MNDILIADQDLLAQKIGHIQDAGLDQLGTVVDWDRTMIRAWNDKGQDTTSYSIIAHSGCLPNAYADEMDRLYERYRPVEVSQTLSSQQKNDAMHDWWAAAFDLMRQFGLTEDMVVDIARRDLMCLRDEADIFFETLVEHDIPTLILSAGIGNVIEIFLNTRGLLLDQVEIKANRLVFDSLGVVQGFVEPVIHSLNKRVVDLDYGLRRNVLLLGDTLEDAQMVDDTTMDCVIRVGFLNQDIEKNSDLYLHAYDVVVCRDGSMHEVNKLIRQIVGG